MIKRSTERILTTHTGSLPRSEALVALLAARDRGESIDEDSFVSEAEASSHQVIQMQAEVGIDVGNNGEQSRVSFAHYVTYRMSGFGGTWERRVHKDALEFPGLILSGGPVSAMRGPKCIGPVKYERLDEAERECDDFLKHVADSGAGFEELFMTAISPGVVATRMLNEHYRDYEEYVFTVAEEMRKEYELIVSKGLVLQLDCPDLGAERHISYQDEPLSAFQDLVRLNIRAINQAIRNIPPDMVRLHVCWGNREGPHHYDVPVIDILPLLYEAHVGALVMEMANPRHAHEYEAYRQHPLPEHMLIVCGVIDTKTNYIEHPEVVADRIRLAAQAVGDPSRIIAGTDCGFDTLAGSRRVDRGIVWGKLRALSQGAEIASRDIAW